MKVSELISQLQSMPQDAEVILQKDAEGNGYSPLSEADCDCIYVPRSTYHGEVLSTKWTWQEADIYSSEQWEEFKRDNPRCVVLAPVN